MGRQMVVCVLVSALAVSSCTAMQPRPVIHPDKPPLAGLKAGDSAVDATRAGQGGEPFRLPYHPWLRG